MIEFSRRSFLHRSGMMFAAGSLVPAFCSRVLARGDTSTAPFTNGYGPLVRDPAKLLDLPESFRYRALSREGDALTGGGRVPACHDGTAAFSAGADGNWLIRNHELSVGDAKEGRIQVAHRRDHVYDPAGVGGTTTLLVSHDRVLRSHEVSLSGTLDNCAGGPSPWHTWLTCEETEDVLDKPHGYVFEVDPVRGGNPEPIRALGRFAHEAVSFDRSGVAYLTEDAHGPFGCIYRFLPDRPLGGRGSLHAGGSLQAMIVDGVHDDLSSVLEPRTRRKVRWIDVPNRDPQGSQASVREQVIGKGATPVQKAEGTWLGLDGAIWLVSSYGSGPDSEDPETVSARAHSGQIWRYDPRSEQLELVVALPIGSPYDGPDTITAGPYGFAVACTDGEGDQWLIGITPDGKIFPFAKNARGDDEFTGATFSPDGQTLYANLQDAPSTTFAIWGPWTRGG